MDELKATLRSGFATEEVEQAWATEIERRSQEIDSGQSGLRNWDEARDEILADLRGGTQEAHRIHEEAILDLRLGARFYEKCRRGPKSKPPRPHNRLQESNRPLAGIVQFPPSTRYEHCRQ